MCFFGLSARQGFGVAENNAILRNEGELQDCYMLTMRLFSLMLGRSRSCVRENGTHTEPLRVQRGIAATEEIVEIGKIVDASHIIVDSDKVRE